MTSEIYVSAAVEGLIDEAVARKLIWHVGAMPGAVYGRSGKRYLRQKLAGYNNAARRSRWIVLVDLDGEENCATTLVRSWLPAPAPLLCFRVAVRTTESWLLSDPEMLCAFLRVSQKLCPADPEAVSRPKIAMINLARKSRSRDVCLDIVPRRGSGRVEGPAYNSRMIEFATNHWRPDRAAMLSDSLRRAIRCLRRLVATNIHHQ